MRLKFKSKESTSRENNIDSSKIEDIVKNNFRFEESIIKDKNYKEFIKLLNSFYNGTEDELNGRRGRFLELIWDVVGTYNGKEFTQKIDEAIVLENEVKISEKDIDIVYIGEIKDKGIANFIEMHECKASANTTLRTPLKPKHRGKLELMQSVIEISETEEIKCDGLIITFNANKRRLERKLKSYGFEYFKIIPRAEIEERVFDK